LRNYLCIQKLSQIYSVNSELKPTPYKLLHAKLCMKTRNNTNVSGAKVWVSRANFIPKKTDCHKINEALKLY